MPDLKNCPMCGSEPTGVGFDTDECAWVECGNCGLSIPEMYDDFAAAEAWNRRVRPEGMVSVPREPTEAMVAAAENMNASDYERPAMVWQVMLAAALERGEG